MHMRMCCGRYRVWASRIPRVVRRVRDPPVSPPLLSFLLADTHARPFVDLAVRDEDGLGLISFTILGFGSESDRDVEREESVRLLISEGADVSAPDNGASSREPAPSPAPR